MLLCQQLLVVGGVSFLKNNDFLDTRCCATAPLWTAQASCQQPQNATFCASLTRRMLKVAFEGREIQLCARERFFHAHKVAFSGMASTNKDGDKNRARPYSCGASGVRRCMIASHTSAPTTVFASSMRPSSTASTSSSSGTRSTLMNSSASGLERVKVMPVAM